ncbi:hypothetical protein [Comamonas terrae]|uniref:Uncharacterized protein n=1 Tax=Comamonas terrae TaxID=673548 RepID=A0ABW5UGY6_9BURK|nr:hypothetical protein [Comamonas terrae]
MPIKHLSSNGEDAITVNTPTPSQSSGIQPISSPVASTFGINLFRSVQDGVHYRSDDLTWEEFTDFMIEEGHQVSPCKEAVKLFNATRFKTLDEAVKEDRGGYREDPDGTQLVRRQQRNAVAVELLIVDYDGTLTLDEARERFKDYEYLGYTSHSHLKTPDVHKFRLIFPLTSPIPAHQYHNEYGMLQEQGVFYDLSEALQAFAPTCDPVIARPAQVYYLPSVPEERKADAVIWRNHGTVLDWTTWKHNSAYARDPHDSSPVPRKASGLPNRTLDPDQVFQHRQGTIRASEVTGRIQHVCCPFHGDTQGSEFLARYPSGVVCFHCKHCGSFTLPPSHRLTLPIQQEMPDTLHEMLENSFEPVWLDHEDRQHIARTLESYKRDILADRAEGMGGGLQFKSHVIYLPEGAGKSQLAMSFLRDPPQPYFPPMREALYRHQIIFACKSWKQVREKEASFRPQLQAIGRSCRIAWSFDGSIERRFNVKVRRKAGGPFIPGDLIPDETFEDIRRENPRLSEKFIRVAWTILGDDPVRFKRMAIPDHVDVTPDTPVDDEDLIFDDMGSEPPAMIFTTFAQLRLLAAKHDRIPMNWIIWIDDPDLDEFLDIKPRHSSAKADDAKTRTIDGTNYDIRPEVQSLGVPFKHHRCIYTTTERMTLRLLENHLGKHHTPYTVHGKRQQVTGGKITLLGTDKVQTKFDALIPLLIRRLEKDHQTEITLIADGIPADFNHSTNKGRNDLKNRNILAELSVPHPTQIKTVCDALGLKYSEHQRAVGHDLMVDKMHQAIGRNSGFRTSGAECVVLVDKKRHAAIVNECGYLIDTANSVIIDKTAKMGRSDSRLTDSASPLVKQIERFLNHPTEYLSDFRKVKPDIQFVLDQLENPTKKSNYIVRLLVALTSVSQVRFDHDPSSSVREETHMSSQIRKLGEWVLTLIQPDEREKVLIQYRIQFEK